MESAGDTNLSRMIALDRRSSLAGECGRYRHLIDPNRRRQARDIADQIGDVARPQQPRPLLVGRRLGALAQDLGVDAARADDAGPYAVARLLQIDRVADR